MLFGPRVFTSNSQRPYLTVLLTSFMILQLRVGQQVYIYNMSCCGMNRNRNRHRRAAFARYSRTIHRPAVACKSRIVSVLLGQLAEPEWDVEGLAIGVTVGIKRHYPDEFVSPGYAIDAFCALHVGGLCHW